MIRVIKWKESEAAIQGSRNRQIIKAVIALLVGGIYLLNPTAGLIELLPDVLPVVGNLDEAAATALLLYGIRELRGATKALPTTNPAP